MWGGGGGDGEITFSSCQEAEYTRNRFIYVDRKERRNINTSKDVRIGSKRAERRRRIKEMAIKLSVIV
jgi:hypothetical protein